jgi:hypothetical protein
MMTTNSKLDALRQAVEQYCMTNTGLEEVQRCLIDAWPELEGSDEESTTKGKLSNRIEELSVNDCFLTFKLERHGGTVQGSTRADVHWWTVDLAKGEATITRKSPRQVRKASPPFPFKEVCQEVVEAVRAGVPHQSIDWKGADRFKLLMGNLVPCGGIKQTTSGRRKKLREFIEAALGPLGWIQEKPNFFHRSAIQG